MGEESLLYYFEKYAQFYIPVLLAHQPFRPNQFWRVDFPHHAVRHQLI